MKIPMFIFVLATALTSCTKENLAEDQTILETMATEGSEGDPEDKREDPNQ